MKSYRVHKVLDAARSPPVRPGNDNTLQPKGAEGLKCVQSVLAHIQLI